MSSMQSDFKNCERRYIRGDKFSRIKDSRAKIWIQVYVIIMFYKAR